MNVPKTGLFIVFMLTLITGSIWFWWWFVGWLWRHPHIAIGMALGIILVYGLIRILKWYEDRSRNIEGHAE